MRYLLDTALQKAMKKAEVNLNLTVEEAIRSLKQVKLAELRLKGARYQIITGAKRYTVGILNAIRLGGYKKLLPRS